MYTNELMLMISNFLYGDLSAEDFSFDFPARLCHVYDELEKENENLAQLFNDELADVCQWYDPHDTGEADTYSLQEFRQKVYEIYFKALPMSVKLEKIS